MRRIRSAAWTTAAALLAVALMASCGKGGGGGSAPPGTPGSGGAPSSAVVTTIIPPGAICPSGGVQIDSGIDDNRNGVLDPVEVDHSEVVCNGTDGIAFLVATSPEPAGVNCAEGGARVDSGADSNANGVLDPAEITATEFICNGATGGVGGTTLTAVSTEPPGANCTAGGLRIDTGLDANGNGVLDPGEITATEFVCDGVDGTSPLITAFDGPFFRMDQVADQMFDVFRAGLDGGEPFRISSIVVLGGGVKSGYRVSPDRTWLAYVADQEVRGVTELFVVDLLSGGTPLKASGPLVAGGRVLDFAWAPDSSSIAYRAEQDLVGVAELYATRLSDGFNRKVSGPLVVDGHVLDFAWAPDSSRVAYRADQETFDTIELYTSFPFLVSGNVKVSGPMTAVSDVFEFAWAPDSSRIAYLANPTTSTALELYTALPTGAAGTVRVSGSMVAGGSVQRLHPQGGNVAWAPDSSRIAYRADQFVDNEIELMTVLPTGTLGAFKVSGPMATGGDVSEFAWAPDSSRIAYLADQDTDGVTELYTGVPNAFEDNVKLSGPLVANGGVSGFFWAPDASRIAYIAAQDRAFVGELYTAVPDVLQDNVNVSGPMAQGSSVQFVAAWAPDSSRIAYPANQDAPGVVELFTALPTGSAGTVKVSGPMATGGNVFSFAWAPDSSRIAYVANQDAATVVELYATLPASASGIVKLAGTIAAGRGVRDFSW